MDAGDPNDPHHLLAIANLAERLAYAHNPWLWPWHDDVHSDALLGVCQARHRYNPAHGVPFHVYALRRARGAILDGIRDRAPLTRRQAHQGTPKPLSLDALIADGLDLHQLIPAPRDPHLDRIDNLDAVRRVLEQLPPWLADILIAVDLHGETLASYGRGHGYTESRASQIRKQALRAARRLLA
jgi:RNA polymerase sigma factor (sigma-70 family)